MRMKEFGGYPIDLQFYRYIMYSWHHNVFINILGDPVVIANIYCKSRNLLRKCKITVQICGNFWVTQYDKCVTPKATLCHRQLSCELPV